MDNNELIIYSINVEDVQTLAVREFGRELTNDETTVVEGKIGD